MALAGEMYPALDRSIIEATAHRLGATGAVSERADRHGLPGSVLRTCDRPRIHLDRDSAALLGG